MAKEGAYQLLPLSVMMTKGGQEFAKQAINNDLTKLLKNEFSIGLFGMNSRGMSGRCRKSLRIISLQISHTSQIFQKMSSTGSALRTLKR